MVDTCKAMLESSCDASTTQGDMHWKKEKGLRETKGGEERLDDATTPTTTTTTVTRYYYYPQSPSSLAR